ncbi:MAG: PaREP1 family protein [Thermoproteus sp. AZ2]|uniref:PaREP1 family protein n=1 Tax=Thermoproteus sp. AZ2 TaxID=1609232 RepID=A0ACC6V2A1_9CREN
MERPWLDLDGYIKVRLLEAKYEAELAAKFLEQGLVRNAAGKAYQAWKAVLGALAARSRDRLEGLYPGIRRIGERAVPRVDWIIAIMPSSKMREAAQALRESYGHEVMYYALLALDLHGYQYNGPDREGVFSRFPSDEQAAKDVEELLKGVAKFREVAGGSL